jgi:hypothetical protein
MDSRGPRWEVSRRSVGPPSLTGSAVHPSVASETRYPSFGWRCDSGSPNRAVHESLPETHAAVTLSDSTSGRPWPPLVTCIQGNIVPVPPTLHAEYPLWFSASGLGSSSLGTPSASKSMRDPSPLKRAIGNSVELGGRYHRCLYMGVRLPRSGLSRVPPGNSCDARVPPGNSRPHCTRVPPGNSRSGCLV